MKTEWIKRAVRYIFKGIPQEVINVNIGQIQAGESLKGKSVWITGGSSGIGFYIAKKCLNEGAKVIISGRNKEKLIDAGRKLGGNVSIYCFDVAETSKTEAAIADVAKMADGIDCAVCCAGIYVDDRSFWDVTEESYDRQFGINLRGNYFLAKRYAECCMNESRQGNIVMISSERGLQCDDVPYGMTRAAMNNFVRGMARRSYGRGVRINAVAPGVLASDIQAHSDGNLKTDCNPCGRLFVPEEIAEVVWFLISDASKCISGEIIACDAGGYLNPWF